MSGVLRHDVHVTKSDNTVIVLPAGSVVPSRLRKYVTNPKAYVSDESPAEAKADEADGDESGEGYAGWTIEKLKDTLEKRELPQSGSKAELVERLDEDDKERDALGSADEADGDESGEEIQE